MSPKSPAARPSSHPRPRRARAPDDHGDHAGLGGGGGGGAHPPADLHRQPGICDDGPARRGVSACAEHGRRGAGRRRGAAVGGAAAGPGAAERVAGSDLIYQLAAQAAQHGWRVYYLGAAAGVAEATAARLRAQSGAGRAPLPAAPARQTRRRLWPGCRRPGPICCWWPMARQPKISGLTAIKPTWACR